MSDEPAKIPKGYTDIITHVHDPWILPTISSGDQSPTDPPMSVADFGVKFKKQTEFANKIDRARYEGKRMIVVKGKVKSGKSLFPRYISAIHKPVAGHTPKLTNYFLSSYNRKSDRGQFDDHKAYGLKTYALFNKSQVQKCLDDIEMDLMAGRIVNLHIDELDYGSGWRGLLARIWNAIKDKPKVMCVFYSATPEELLKSDAWNSLSAAQKELFRYEPVEEYCGDLTFLQNGLIEDAEPAFTVGYDGETPRFDLGAQFKTILDQAKANVTAGEKPYIIVLRLCYELPGYKGKSKKDKRAFTVFLNQFGELFHRNGFRVIYDKEDAANISTKYASPLTIDWGNRAAWESYSMPTILMIDQKCTRSTEIKFHDYIYAWHEWRPKYSYTISVQAEQRVVHYRGKAYPTFNPIKVFGNLDTWLRSADLLTDTQYLAKDVEIRLTPMDGFDPEQMVSLLRKQNFVHAVEHLKDVALAVPSLQFFRVAAMKEDKLAQLRTLVESKKATHKFSAFLIKERTNILDIAPRVSSENRGAEVQVEREFFPWPKATDGTYEDYGHYQTEGSLAQKIHAFRQEHSDAAASDEEASGSEKHFNKLKLDPRYEHDLTQDERKKCSTAQAHTKTADGRYISLFQPAGDDKLHRSCSYEEIKDATTGLENPRQTLIYKGNILGVFVRIPTGEMTFNTASETTAASMYANRGRGRGRGRPT